MAEPLTCQEARALVSAYMNQDLDEEQARAVEAHIASCSTCPTLYAGLVSVQYRLGGMPRLTLSSDDVTRMIRRFNEGRGV
jgi:RNA polymerase sigma-70 factor (ECF subfamily)